MGYIYLIIGIMILAFPLSRFILFHIPQITYWGIKDLRKYIKYKRWNECPEYGHIYDYTGLFGQGKTKECVRYITSLYERYNDKPIYNFKIGEWAVQKIVVYSNVEFEHIPYVPFNSLQQLVDCQGNDFGVVSIFFCDEASVIFNSRNFKSNLPTPALNSILTSRHHKISVFLTSQRFGHVDALLRQVTHEVFECSYFKPLRIQKICVYDAWDMENCGNVRLLKPLRVQYFHSTDRVYSLYDTDAVVDDINRRLNTDDFVSDSEILDSQSQNGDYHLVQNGRKRLRKMQK